MKKTIINIAIILGIVAITFGATRQFFPKTVDRTVTDTTYVPTFYEVEKIKEVEKPVIVTRYKTKVDTVTKIEIHKDTVYITTPSETFGYHSSFLTNYSYAPKMLNVASTQSGVSFTGLWPDGTTETKTYQHTPYFKLGYSRQNLTIQRLNPSFSDRFSHSIGAGYFQSFQYGYPYVKYNPRYDIFGVTLEGNLYLTEQPFGTIGVSYEFGR